MTQATTAEGTGAKRLVLGFDAGCGTCSDLAERVQERIGEKLAVRNLRDPEVEGWREEALGKAAPWAPTLFEIEGEKVRAWVGVKMGLALSRRLGPKDTWRVMQLLGEIGASPGIEAAVEELPEKAQEAVAGISRGQFLKGVGGATVAAMILSNGAVFPSVAEAATSPAASTGTLAQRQLAKTIVRNSAPYRTLANQQAQIGASFDWSRAIIRAGSTNVATVQVTSAHRRRAFQTIFFVNLRTRSLMFYNGVAFTRYNYSEVKVTRLVNLNSAPYPWLRLGGNYVVTATGTRMTIQQFKANGARVVRQRITQQQRSPQATPYEQCLLDHYAERDQLSTYLNYGCGGTAVLLGLGAFFVPPLGAVGLGVTVGCIVVGAAGLPSPEQSCAGLKPPPPVFTQC